MSKQFYHDFILEKFYADNNILERDVTSIEMNRKFQPIRPVTQNIHAYVRRRMSVCVCEGLISTQGGWRGKKREAREWKVKPKLLPCHRTNEILEDISLDVLCSRLDNHTFAYDRDSSLDSRLTWRWHKANPAMRFFNKFFESKSLRSYCDSTEVVFSVT